MTCSTDALKGRFFAILSCFCMERGGFKQILDLCPDRSSIGDRAHSLRPRALVVRLVVDVASGCSTCDHGNSRSPPTDRMQLLVFGIRITHTDGECQFYGFNGGSPKNHAIVNAARAGCRARVMF